MRKKYLLKCESFQIYDGNMWFVSGNFLCCRNLSTGEISLETCIIPQQGPEGNFFCTLSGRYDNRMICIPEMADRIVDYDIKTKERRVFFLSNTQCDSYIKYRSSCYINGKVYIMPNLAQNIIVYDPKSESIDYFTDWFNVILGQCGSYIDNKNGLFSLARQIEEKIYFSTTFSNILCCFDTQNGHANVIHIGPTDYQYQLFYYLDGVFYLIDNVKQRIVRWSENDGVIGQFEGISFNVSIPESLGDNEAEYRFFDAFNFEKKIYLPACFAESSLMIDTLKEQVNICEPLSQVHGSCFVGSTEQKEAIITSVMNNELFVVNKDLMVRRIELELLDDGRHVGDTCCFEISASEKNKACRYWWNENQEATLSGFIKYI